jgi:hypothetical protein
MSDPSHQPDHNLSEISHLFLSSVRDKTTGGAPRPQRTPPPRTSLPKPAVSIDLTPEEFAQVFADEEADKPQDRGPAPVPQVTAIIGGHLNGKQFDRVKEYARHLAAEGTRVGLIEIDASEFRVMCFDRESSADASAAAAAAPIECSFDPRRMNEVLEEMSWDVQRWLLVLPTPRVPEARALLRDAPRWTLLSTCDHDGVISCYRTLKGLTDLWPSGPAGDKPQLSLALLDAQDDDQAERVSAKLSSVCQQFLNWPLATEPAVQPAQRVSEHRVSEHLVMCCRPNRDKGQLANAPQWEIVADLIRRSREAVVAETVAPAAEAIPADAESVADEMTPEPAKRFVADVVVPVRETAREAAPAAMPRAVTMQYVDPPISPIASPIPSATSIDKTDATDVIDLPGPDNGESGIVDAILKHCANELVECPVTPPMCPRAKLAVGRDHRIVMLAVSREGLSDLNTIGLAYKWLQENQNLIGMAVPQLSIDTHQAPHLSLLVNQADSTAHTLQPMLEGGNVTVKTYRKLRWGGKTGLLLEAA